MCICACIVHVMQYVRTIVQMIVLIDVCTRKVVLLLMHVHGQVCVLLMHIHTWVKVGVSILLFYVWSFAELNVLITNLRRQVSQHLLDS